MIQRTQQGLNRRLKQVPFLKGWYEQRQFRIERDLIDGRTHKVVDHPSILHFSVNKAATQYTKRLLIKCVREKWIASCTVECICIQSRFSLHLHTDCRRKPTLYSCLSAKRVCIYRIWWFGGRHSKFRTISKSDYAAGPTRYFGFRILLVFSQPHRAPGP